MAWTTWNGGSAQAQDLSQNPLDILDKQPPRQTTPITQISPGEMAEIWSDKLMELITEQMNKGAKK